MSNSKIELQFPDENLIPDKYRITQKYYQREYLIDGKILKWDGEIQEVISPVWEKKGESIKPRVIGSYPLLTETEAEEALQAAEKAYNKGRGEWPTMSIEGRIKCLEDFVVRMKETREEVVKLLMWEIGKTLKDSEKEFDRTVDYIGDTIDALKDLDRISSRFEIEQGIIAQIRRAPLGIVLCMGPFNYPLNETFTTLIPALIMGNTVIFKPPKLGVLLHQPLLEAFKKSFPPGVVNTVYGEGQKVISPLMKSGKIDVLAFIGSCKVADILKAQHPAPHRLKCVLGLEAKNVGLILPDADIEQTVKECITGSLSYNGQRCTALKILFVHKKISKRFLELFRDGVNSLKSGMPWDENVSITPLPENGKVETLNSYVEESIKDGAEIVNKDDGGGESCGSLYKPAVLFPVSPRSKLYQEEQFGPIVPVCEFDDIEQPVEYIINSRYGQQVSVFGKDPDTIATLVDIFVNQVCRVNINSQCQRGPDTFPFAGRKDSAEGTLSVTDALKVFSIRTLVAAKEGDLTKEIIRDITRGQKSKFLSTDFIL